jgi:hypothetical protein
MYHSTPLSSSATGRLSDKNLEGNFHVTNTVAAQGATAASGIPYLGTSCRLSARRRADSSCRVVHDFQKAQPQIGAPANATAVAECLSCTYIRWHLSSLRTFGR